MAADQWVAVDRASGVVDSSGDVYVFDLDDLDRLWDAGTPAGDVHEEAEAVSRQAARVGASVVVERVAAWVKAHPESSDR